MAAVLEARPVTRATAKASARIDVLRGVDLAVEHASSSPSWARAARPRRCCGPADLPDPGDCTIVIWRRDDGHRGSASAPRQPQRREIGLARAVGLTPRQVSSIHDSNRSARDRRRPRRPSIGVIGTPASPHRCSPPAEARRRRRRRATSPSRPSDPVRASLAGYIGVDGLGGGDSNDLVIAPVVARVGPRRRGRDGHRLHRAARPHLRCARRSPTRCATSNSGDRCVDRREAALGSEDGGRGTRLARRRSRVVIARAAAFAVVARRR